MQPLGSTIHVVVLIVAGAWLLGAGFVWAVVAGAAKIERRTDLEHDREVAP